MKHQELEQYLLRQLAKVNASEESIRVNIYKAALTAAERLDPDKRDTLQSGLIIAIERLEKNRPWIVTRGAISPDVNEIANEKSEEKLSVSISVKKFRNAIRQIKLGTDVVFPIASILLIIPPLLLLRGEPIFSKTETIGYKPELEQIQEKSVVADSGYDTTLVSMVFPNDIAQISSDPYFKIVYSVGENEFQDADSLLIKSEQTLYFGSFFEVASNSTYLMSIRFALENNNGAMPSIDAGFVFFDRQKQIFPNEVDGYKSFVNKGLIDINSAATEGSDFQVSNYFSNSDKNTLFNPEKGVPFARAVISFSPRINNGVILKQLTITRLVD